MTETDFRSNAGFVDRVREVFNDPVIQALLIMLKDSTPIADALDADPEIVSVRKLSRIDGYDECLMRLFAASTLLPPKNVQITETWEPEQPQPA